MGRRKIDIQYLADDRVRKVTFCKRKGGLFKKADDLAKLCGVEVGVIIVCENQQKTCTYASTNLDRVINRYKDLSDSGGNNQQIGGSQEVDELYHKLEMKRRELEEAQRQLLQERKKVEAFVGQDVQMLTVRPVDMTQMNPPALPGPGVQYGQQQQQQQQQQQWQSGPSDAIMGGGGGEPVFPGEAPGSTPVTMSDGMGAPSEAIMMGGDDAAVLEEPSAKRAKLNEPMIPPPEPE